MLLAVSEQRKKWIAFLALLLIALAFRIAMAHRLANDAPEDGKVYSQIARNVLEQHVYSHDTEAPYEPSLIRAPGYPLFLAIIYKAFGHTNNGAVRIIQAVIDTASCALVALLAFCWQPDEKRKRATAIAALAVAAVNPFTTIYAATILAEVPTIFFALATCVAATIAFRGTFTTENTEEIRKRDLKKSVLWWCLSGLLAGLGTMFRPDTLLFVLAICAASVIASLWNAVVSKARHRFGSVPSLPGRGVRGEGLARKALTPGPLPEGEGEYDLKRRRRFGLPPRSKFSQSVFAVAIFSIAFLLMLAPWTIRNWRVFHLFQPLQPMHAEMPGEFVPRGYSRWLKTWIDDQRYIDPFWWELDVEQIKIDDLPDSAFDSPAERERVAALLNQYNHPPDANGAEPTPSPSPTPQPSPTPPSKNEKQANANSNANNSEEEKSDENDNSNEETDSADNGESDQSKPEEHLPVKMTPEIDAGFAQLAAERIARHPFRYYVWVPAKRAHALWFNTHSDFYPFEGALLPLDELDYDAHQQIWLPLFAALVAIYTLLGVAGVVVLWLSQNFYARCWALLAVIIFFGRLAFFSTVESPEPRYVVELFPILCVLGGLAINRGIVFLRQLRDAVRIVAASKPKPNRSEISPPTVRSGVRRKTTST